MELTHRFRVPASVEETWTAFNHLDRLAPCFPGATISNTDGDQFEGSMKIKIGPLALVYNGSGRFRKRDAATRRLVFEASGADRRGNGTATATVTTSLVGNGSATDVEVRTRLAFTGRPAQFGREVVSDVADKLLDQFASCISGRFAEGIGRPGPEDVVTRAPVASDDELWEEWATAEDAEDESEPSDIEQTVEMAAVSVSDDGSDLVTDEAWLAEDDSAPVEDEAAVEQEATEPAALPTAPPPPWRYTPPSDLSQPAASVVANVVTTLLRRYGPLLGFLSLVIVIVIRLVNRRRR
jgi:uncharacterized protein